jgi:hypothetical protein
MKSAPRLEMTWSEFLRCRKIADYPHRQRQDVVQTRAQDTSESGEVQLRGNQ